ncbi:tetratricopeptide repeat protein [Qipengyuania flava]|uniref:tetratricopeptide repeat protein n=1 Tax=Qipengyuania flava TaxID=192812 RepID=UPI001CD2333B|nr:tetratricopeptide repeat protein [Qipengyuania flava]MCA0889015.1 tetratricopeptide repeat protein [Qipengyuania flava]
MTVDAIPPQAWIALPLAVSALAPAAYVWRYFTHDLTPRDITLPPEDLTWKSGRHLLFCLALLTGLLAIGGFAFTEWAENLARSEWLAPAFLGAIGSYALGTVVPGWRNGEIEPLIRGSFKSYSRGEQAKRYWASLIWNGAIGLAFTAGSFGTLYGNSKPACDDNGNEKELFEAVATCNAMLADHDLDVEKRAELLGDRGRVHHRLGNNHLALLDYSKAIELEPGDSYALFNRALIHRELRDLPNAIKDLDASLAVRPENDRAYLERGLANLDYGRFEKAVEDFTLLDNLVPDHPYALANRGLAYAWMDDELNAQDDFRRVGKNQPGWVVVLHGKAVLARNRQNHRESIDYLSQALEIDPDDYFALRLRADAYWEIGEKDLARDDDDRSIALAAED